MIKKKLENQTGFQNKISKIIIKKYLSLELSLESVQLPHRVQGTSDDSP